MLLKQRIKENPNWGYKVQEINEFKQLQLSCAPISVEFRYTKEISNSTENTLLAQLRLCLN